jgi:hypothetical protein
MRNIKDAIFTNNISRSFGNPTNKTLLHAVRHNWIDVPGLTGKILSQNPPLSTATSQVNSSTSTRVARRQPFLVLRFAQGTW